MRPLPVSGGMQRESGTFLVPFPYFPTYCFILNAFQNEKSSRSACKSGKRKPYLVMAEP
jgi:hypothetical protein